ncbi:hypothetical protein ASPCADRAFT_405533 [Aspergillus carbonarius ITEM 5010]|uniref:Restriction endonuclease domain-containing protein n=1 Tax=Aspergillus carbonarius (strain ITEM 5010) TaxID=602072 RepID=A0A1R3RMY6_ASPC5|nr:hypothetical protein ASPCADRAFT_405533 [Aspergillus carbonarius ITEM 5010]
MAPSTTAQLIIPIPMVSVIPSCQLAMTGLHPPKTFTNLTDVNKAIRTKVEKLQAKDVTQYISYKHVSPQKFTWIDEHRDQLECKVRFAYYPDISTMIIKIPTREHEITHTNIGETVTIQIRNMGIPRDEYLALGATIYVGPTASKKESDAAWINPTLRPKHDDWPFLVMEVGVSESLSRLRQDVAWWISNSRGQVRIVLLIQVTRSSKRIVLEKYIPKEAVYPRTRARAALPPVYVPDLVSTTTVNHGVSPPVVTGGRMVLEFEKVIGRPPIAPEEDIELTPALLIDATRFVFRR